jgi:diguanylate cyclase (GGDEF)-like protein
MKLGRIVPLSGREWVPAALVSALVLLGGARLIMLSTQQRIAENREATAGVAERTASRIEAELEALAERAHREAARAVDASRVPQGFESIAPDEQSFWTTRDGSIEPAAYPSGDAAAREALAREWRAGDGDPQSGAIEWLAPVRHGSQWLIAARAPILRSSGSDVEQAGWAVAYRSLDDMLLSTGIAEISNDGYEAALGEPTSGRDALRLLTGSPFVAAQDHVTGAVRLPDARGAGTSAPYMVLALRLRGGWYSPVGLVASIGLLLLLAWLLGLAASDLVHSEGRWRTALALARRRLSATNRRLSEELEERRQLQQSFEHARFHDTFTGLPNRRYFMKRLDEALRDRGGRGQQIAVILLDVDRFKLINDTLGQTAGDELMVQVARRFENQIGDDVGHVLARWSGDQFALLLTDVHSSDTAVTFATLLVETLGRPLVLRRHTLSVAAHTGITCVDADLQRPEDIVREADIALSVAKRREAAGPVVYEPALGEDVVSTVSLEADLHVALERQQLRLLFQPIVELAAGRIVGAEALLRWRHPVEGLLGPDRILALAEDARLIIPITQWVIRRACTLGDEWRRSAPVDEGFYVSVNLAATVLEDPRLVAYIARVLQETGLPAECLKLELTEGDLTRHVGAAREVLDALHDMGIGLVLDDFGTGHSSLSYLELFPIDCVKIDRPFVNADGSDSELMRCVVHMASSLGLEAVAEKVETAAAVQALGRMGCKYGQGYLLGEPVEAEELLARLGGRVAMPATADAATLAQAGLREPVTPDAPALVLREQPGTGAADETIEQPRAAEPAALEAPTVIAAARAAPAADSPTLVVPRPPEHASPDAPTLVHPVSWKPVDADAPTLLQPASWKPVAPDSPTLVLRERPSAVAPDDATSERPRPPDAVAFVSPDATTFVERGDEADGGDETSMLVEPTPEAFADDAPTRTRARRGRFRRSGA